MDQDEKARNSIVSQEYGVNIIFDTRQLVGCDTQRRAGLFIYGQHAISSDILLR